MVSPVLETEPAASEEVVRFYERRLQFETDCADVKLAQENGEVDFVLVDLRGTKKFEKAHVPGAIDMPVGKMTPRRLAEWPQETVFVVYCAGPHCNGTDKAALHLGSVGRKVKVMIGGMTGWADEGYDFASGAAV